MLKYIIRKKQFYYFSWKTKSTFQRDLNLAGISIMFLQPNCREEEKVMTYDDLLQLLSTVTFYHFQQYLIWKKWKTKKMCTFWWKNIFFKWPTFRDLELFYNQENLAVTIMFRRPVEPFLNSLSPCGTACVVSADWSNGPITARV